MPTKHCPKIPLSPSEVDILITLNEVEPADVRLIDFSMAKRRTSASVLPRLVRKGLAIRKRADAQVPLSRDEKWEGKHLRIGKRPYMYELTKPGKTVAHHLQAISNQLRDVTY